jgi:hypothetical protein
MCSPELRTKMQVTSLTRRITVVRLALNNTGFRYTEVIAVWGSTVNGCVKKTRTAMGAY